MDGAAATQMHITTTVHHTTNLEGFLGFKLKPATITKHQTPTRSGNLSICPTFSDPGTPRNRFSSWFVFLLRVQSMQLPFGWVHRTWTGQKKTLHPTQLIEITIGFSSESLRGVRVCHSTGPPEHRALFRN